LVIFHHSAANSDTFTTNFGSVVDFIGIPDVFYVHMFVKCPRAILLLLLFNDAKYGTNMNKIK